jgi:glycosyltransferase involved in cell wall biosynthesis
LDLLLPAFSRAARQFPDHMLVIAGPDEAGMTPELTRMAREGGVESRVLFTGPVYGATKIGLLRQAQLFALTSYSEGLPLAVLEAMDCGVPVLLTTACNLPEVAEAEAGLVVSPTIMDLAQGLTSMLAANNWCREMGLRGKDLIASRFTWDKIALQTLNLCTDILNSLPITER